MTDDRTISSIAEQEASHSSAPISSLPNHEEYHLIHTGGPRKAPARTHIIHDEEEEPLVDTTAPLTLISKKTKRLEKQQARKQSKQASKQQPSNFLELPSELLVEVLGWLKPSEIFSLKRLNHATNDFILQNERQIARNILSRRYPVLSRCFPLPIAATGLDDFTQSILLTPRRQDMLAIHKKPYQHIRSPNPEEICSCMWCILCWNNLNIILDFAHFQAYLNKRDPIPIIKRGTNPSWNIELTTRNAAIVGKAMTNPLTYAGILQKHLSSIISTLTRKHLHHRQVLSASGKWVPSKETFLLPVYPERPYELTDHEAQLASDHFLERLGSPNYEFPYHRDMYYSLEAYVPNRKWKKDEERWLYYGVGMGQHGVDIALAIKWFSPKVAVMPVEQGIQGLKIGLEKEVGN